MKSNVRSSSVTHGPQKDDVERSNQTREKLSNLLEDARRLEKKAYFSGSRSTRKT